MNPLRWLGTQLYRSNHARRAAQAPRSRPRSFDRHLLVLEHLEDRLAPAVITYEWTGLGASNLWSDAGNWINGGPATVSPGNQAVLLFHSNAPQEASVDDIVNL